MFDRGSELASALGIRAQVKGVIKEPTQEMLKAARTNFRPLILANPNFFGNLEASPYEPVMLVASNTHYEELKCVGFNPQFDRLEAVVHVYQETGYGGDICSDGTPEYVRFYLSTDDGDTWQDQGMASFTAYNIPSDKPLEYAVTLQISPNKNLCSTENLPRVRAILSWYDPPPPGTPDHIPVWGNVVEATIQVDKLAMVALGTFLAEAKLKIPAQFKKIIDLNQPLAQVEPQAMSMAELYDLYKDTDVPEHRSLYSGLQKLLAGPGPITSLMKPEFEAIVPNLKANMAKVLEKLLKTDGDISFEELKCVGLNPNDDTLVATLTVKLSSGYSGDLCSPGSREYVAFWEYDEIEEMWLYLGTASVNVHDISSTPAQGLQYSVFLPVDLTRHRRLCTDGPRTLRIRAILSWETPPPPDDPNWVPIWGNREETRVHVAPGPSVPETDHTPIIETVASMSVDDIDNLTGLASGASSGTADFTADSSPFGSTIRITGRLLYPTDSFMGGELPLRYKVSVRSDPGEPWQPLTNSFWVKYATLDSGIYAGPFDHKMDVVDGVWYEYLEDISGAEKRFLTIPRLAEWRTGGDMTGIWEIRIDAHDPNTGIDWPGSQIIKVCLDQKAPSAMVTIKDFQRDGGPWQDAQACGKFQVGDVIRGEYESIDEEGYFRVLTLGVRPGGAGWPSFGATPDPSGRRYDDPGATTNGDSGTWTLDTSGMAPCGYVVHLWTEDRTIVRGGYIGWGNSDDVGFCLEVAS